jgi:hypothetical protein
MPDADTLHDLDLADAELDLQARRAAVLEWNRLPPGHQARIAFDHLVAKHRRRLVRKKEQAAASG